MPTQSSSETRTTPTGSPGRWARFGTGLQRRSERFTGWLRDRAARVHAWLPVAVDRRIRLFAWLSLISQTLIVGTGGAVRLTGSGLGCPTWPYCTEESLIPVAEMGIHGIIEFGNRLLTFLLAAIAIATFALLWRLRRERRDLFRLAILLGCGIPAQAVLGGITVLTGLNPWIVGMHFIVSLVLVALATVFIVRVYRGPGPSVLAVPRPLAVVVHITSLLVAVTAVVGVITTGSGPHAGDEGAARNGLDPAIMQHVHSWPAYATLAFTLVIVAWAWRMQRRILIRWSVGLLAVELVQMTVGIAQARLGLPGILVGIHMVLACVLVSAMVGTVLALKEPVVEQSSVR